MRQLLILFACVILMAGCASTAEIIQRGKADFAQKRYKDAYEKLRPLAVKGNPDAQYAVGYMYYYGKGTTENKKRAIRLIKQAARQGQPDAIKALDILEKHSLGSANLKESSFSVHKK